MLEKMREFRRRFGTKNYFPIAIYGLVLVIILWANLCLWGQPTTASLHSSRSSEAFAKDTCTTTVHTSDIVNALTKASRTNQKMTRADVERLRRETVGETGETLSAEMAQELEEYIRCNEIFLHLFRELAAIRPEAKEWTGQRNANAIIQKIIDNATGKNGKLQWKEVGEADAQILANAGVVVEGVFSNPPGHGHLATVFPVPRGIAKIDLGPPYVMDGNPHVGPMIDRARLEQRKEQRQTEDEADADVKERQLFPSDLGAISFHRSFGKHRIHWYAWLPSMPPKLASAKQIDPTNPALIACDDRPTDQKIAGPAPTPAGHTGPVTGKCLQLPISCSQNSDCKCSNRCASFDGSRENGICQPK